MNDCQMHDFLESNYDRYARADFIDGDPISVPHRFSRKEDIEISGFIAATLAWGQRKMIVAAANRAVEMMDNAPFDFVVNHSAADLAALQHFRYRTFGGNDLQFFVTALRHVYLDCGGLEQLFSHDDGIFAALTHFRDVFFSLPHSHATERHVANVERGSAAKRLHMFLRWMVRNDGRGIDFGLWKNINTADLYMPVDVHCGRVARQIGLLNRPQTDRKAVCELTLNLRRFCRNDPVKYDFALFGIGINKQINILT